jgi:hypothetical protein
MRTRTHSARLSRRHRRFLYDLWDWRYSGIQLDIDESQGSVVRKFVVTRKPMHTITQEKRFLVRDGGCPLLMDRRSTFMRGS